MFSFLKDKQAIEAFSCLSLMPGTRDALGIKNDDNSLPNEAHCFC